MGHVEANVRGDVSTFRQRPGLTFSDGTFLKRTGQFPLCSVLKLQNTDPKHECIYT